MTTLTSYTNNIDGTTAYVIAGTRGGFHACLRDDDSSEVVGVTIFPTLDQADAQARAWAQGAGPAVVSV